MTDTRTPDLVLRGERVLLRRLRDADRPRMRDIPFHDGLLLDLLRGELTS